MRIVEGRRKQRVHKPRTTYLSLTEEECLETLHLSRQVVTDICHLLADDLTKNSNCPYLIPVAVRVMAALHFFATGSFQNPLSSTGGISQSAVSGAIHAVSNALVRHAAKFIEFPNTPESQSKVQQEFMEKFGFRGVLGVIDCTHVPLRAPADNATVYFNKRGNYSINIQIICDATFKFTHVFANYPATTPDSSILDNSAIPAVFQKDPSLEGWLLGDTAYPPKTWLLTPFIKTKTGRESLFNLKHSIIFSVMEKAVGMLKKRFKCLDKPGGTLQYSPQKAGTFFVACCVLHNFALRHGCLPEIDEDTIKNVRVIDAAMHQCLPVDPKTQAAAQKRRAQLAEELFDQ